MRSTTLALLSALAVASVAFAPTMPEHGRGAHTTGVARTAEVGAAGLQGAADLPDQCHDDTGDALALTVDVEGEAAHGAIAFPDETVTGPTALVVFTHGYGHSSASWVGHMQWAADELGAVALAMDYRGTRDLPEDGEVGGTRGWQVKEGAADSIAAALAVLEACPQVEEVVLFGVSMGANAAGLALAAHPVRPDGTTPLFDWWINVEGAANVVETYLEARSLAASGNEFTKYVVEDIEREVGGPIESDPQGYVDLAVVSHVEEIAASGIRGVFHVHGVEDGLVPYDQSRELHVGLGVASGTTLQQEFFTALRRDPDGPAPDEDQANLSDYVVGAADPTWESPLVGHGSEASADNDVMRFSLDRLRRLLVEDEAIGCLEATLDAGLVFNVWPVVC